MKPPFLLLLLGLSIPVWAAPPEKPVVLQGRSTLRAGTVLRENREVMVSNGTMTIQGAAKRVIGMRWMQRHSLVRRVQGATAEEIEVRDHSVEVAQFAAGGAAGLCHPSGAVDGEETSRPSSQLDELPNVRDEILHLPDDTLAVLGEELPRLIPDATLWYGYLERLALELPGWSGMFLWRAENPDRGDGTPVAMADYLAVRVLLERLLCEDLLRRMTGLPLSFDELQGYYLASLGEFHVRDALRRGQLPEALQDEAAALLAAGPGHEDTWAALAGRVGTSGVETRQLAAWRLQQLATMLDLPT